MTQAQFVSEYWPWIVGPAGILNPCFMLPTLYKVCRHGATSGISQLTLTILMYLQFVFGFHGYFTGDAYIMYTNIAAGFTTLVTSLSVLYTRRWR
jgi:uncharacterized protein with PQ loop repeat